MIIEQHAYPIFEENWGADEELLLIEGMKNFGCGNWQDIADHIGGRTKEEVEDHFVRIYLNSPTYPVPQMNKRFDHDPTEFAYRRRERIEEYRRNAKNAAIKQKPSASIPSCHEVQGYMPGRLEFENEYENDAEVTIKDMVFDPDDNETEVELKLTILNIYNSRLTSRMERKRTMIKHDLLEYRKNMTIEKKRTKEERDYLSKVKGYARLMTPKDYQTFVNNLLTEIHCRKRIAELQEYRRNGIRTFAMASKYENDKAVRASSQNGSGSSNIINSNINQMMTSGSRHTANSSSRYSTNFTNPPISTSATSEVFQGSVHPIHHSTVDVNKYLTHDAVNPEELGDSTSAAAAAATKTNGMLSIQNINTNTLPPSSTSRLSGYQSQTKLFHQPVGISGTPLDISRATDVELLTPEEQVLCSQLRILPKPYLAIKETLFRELLRSGGVLRKRTARELVKIDVNKTTRIYEFFQAQRWIS